MAGFVGFAAVHVDDGDGFFSDGLLEVRHADVGKVTGERGGGEDETEGECD